MIPENILGTQTQIIVNIAVKLPLILVRQVFLFRIKFSLYLTNDKPLPCNYISLIISSFCSILLL